MSTDFWHQMESIAATLGASLVQSSLDYSNSIMYGMSASNMHKLQSAQNSLTCVILPSLCHLSASERLSYLHWLPVHYRIQFKIATLTYKTLATCQSSYLYDLLQVHQPSRALRSSTQQLLHVPLYVYWFWSVCLQLQLSCNMEFHPYLR